LLARLLRLGEITAVAAPTVEQERARDLVRAREDCRGDLMRARHRLSKLLLRHGIGYPGGAAWTGKHDAWLLGEAVSQLNTTATRLAFEAGYETVAVVKARRDRLDAAIEQMAADSPYTPVVRRRSCLRGISALTGFALAVEIGDWTRFTGATIGSFVGLTGHPRHAAPRRRLTGPDQRDRTTPGSSTRSGPRLDYEQPTTATLVPTHADPLQPNHRPAVTNPRISV
jgi:transposase